MTNKEAMEIVLNLAEFGASSAAVKGLDGKRLTDKEREQHPEAIYQMQDFMQDLFREEWVALGGVDLKDKKNLDNGLACLADWMKYNTESAWRNEHRLLSDHDYDFYQEVIKEAREASNEKQN